VRAKRSTNIVKPAVNKKGRDTLVGKPSTTRVSVVRQATTLAGTIPGINILSYVRRILPYGSTLADS
jgi:hypothetical protein